MTDKPYEQWLAKCRDTSPPASLVDLIMVTITATPTITPIEVSVARNFASRRFLKASLSRSKNGIDN